MLDYRSAGILKDSQKKVHKIEQVKQNKGEGEVKPAVRWHVRGYLSFPCLQVMNKGKAVFRRSERCNVFSQGYRARPWRWSENCVRPRPQVMTQIFTRLLDVWQSAEAYIYLFLE